MSNYLTGLDQLNPQVKRHNGSTATLTLDENGTTNATMLYVNGVAQTPGIDFNVSGTTLTCTSTLPAGTNIATTIQYFNTGIVNTPADATVTDAKANFVSTSSAAGLQIKGDGTTDGTLQLNCSQNSHGIKLKSPPHSASASYTLTFPNDDGDADQVLKTNGSGVLSWGTGGSGYEFVSAITASDDATVAFTNMVSGYDYQYRWSNLTPATNDALLKAELGTSGPSYLTSGYLGTTMEVNHSASVTSYEYTTYMAISANSMDGTEPDSGAGHWDVFDPAGSGVTKIMGRSINRNSGHTFYNSLQHWYHDTAASHVAVKFYFSSGNVEAGVFAQYRRKLSA